MSFRSLGMAAAVILVAAGGAQAQEVNIYNARHYGTDQQLWDTFTKETGIAVNVVEANHDELIQRLEAEGANSPADIFITVDAGRLALAAEKNLFDVREVAGPRGRCAGPSAPSRRPLVRAGHARPRPGVRQGAGEPHRTLHL